MHVIYCKYDFIFVNNVNYIYISIICYIYIYISILCYTNKKCNDINKT